MGWRPVPRSLIALLARAAAVLIAGLKEIRVMSEAIVGAALPQRPIYSGPGATMKRRLA
jgi:hypothetical protein